MKVDGLRSENGIRMVPVKSQSKYSRFLFYFAAGIIHLFSALYLITMGVVHLVLRRKIEIILLHLQVKTLAGISYIVMGLLHFHALIKLCLMVCYGRKEKEPPPDLAIHLTGNKPMYQVINHHFKRIYYDYISPWGLFGRYGKYYETRIALREFLEIPSQIFQAYMMSNQITDQYVAFSYTILLSINCITSPIMLLSDKYFFRRRYSVFLDGLFDFIFSVLFPSHLIIGKVIDYVVVGEIYKASHPVWGTEAIHMARQFLVAGWIDLITKMMPFLFNYLLLTSLIISIYDSCSKGSSVMLKLATERQSLLELKYSQDETMQSFLNFTKSKWTKRFTQYGSFGMGFTIFLIAYFSINREVCPDSCLLQVYPWLSQDCQCILYHHNCKQNHIQEEKQVHEHLYTISSRTNILILSECPLTKAPPLDSLTRFKNLEMLQFFSSNISSWDIPVSVLAPSLNALYFDGSKLSHIPEVLFNFTSSRFVRFLIARSPLSSIPSNVNWKEIVYLGLNGNQLTSFPSVLYNMPDIEMIQLSDNQIKDFEVPQTFSTNIFNDLDLSDNQLTKIPMSLIIGSTNMRLLYLSGNPIERNEISEDRLVHLKGLNRLNLANTMICESQEWEDKNSLLVKQFHSIGFTYEQICPSDCATGCPDHHLFNYRCDLECYTQECNFDNGECRLFVEIE